MSHVTRDRERSSVYARHGSSRLADSRIKACRLFGEVDVAWISALVAAVRAYRLGLARADGHSIPNA